MAADKIPPSGTPPVSMDTEPNPPAVAGENASSEIQVSPEVGIPLRNHDKAEQCLATFRNPGSVFEDTPRKIHSRNVLCEGFSIREYVAKVRAVDIRKCWPLSESLLDDSLREGRNPRLPPLVRPNYRWWSCLERCGEHTHFGASFDRSNSLCIEPENYSQNFSHIVEQQLMVSLETDPDVGPWISHDERKLRTVQSSAQDGLSHIARSEDDIRNIENERKRVDHCLAEKHDRNFIAPSSLKDGHSEIEAPKRTSMSDVNADQLERIQKRVKANLSDGNHAPEKHTVIRNFDNHTQVKNSTLDLMEKEGDLLNDIGNCKRKAEGMRAPDEAVEQAQEQSDSLECDRSKIDKRNFETAKIETLRQHNIDISTTEGSGVKICPVCKTFTSATITAVNAHMDNCLAQVSKTEKGRIQKQKSRTRKKRSIVDICAAAPPVQISLEYLEHYQMDGQTMESDCSEGMDVSSDLAIEVTDTGTLKEVMNSNQTGSETATRADSTTLKCKRKQPAGAHYLIESGKATNGDGQAESLEMKRRRQRLGIITCASGSKDLKESLKTAKLPPSTQSTEVRQGVEHHLKHHVEDAGKQSKLRQDSNGEQLSNMQLNSEQQSDVARDVVISKSKNQQQWTSTSMDNVTPHPTTDHSATMLPKEQKASEYSVIDILRGEIGKPHAKESTGEPSSVSAISNVTGNVSQISVVGDPVPSRNESPHVHTQKPQVLGDSECRQKNGASCKLQVEAGSSKQGYLDLLNKMHSKGNNKYIEASIINPGKMVGSEEMNSPDGIGTCSKPSVIHSYGEDTLIRPNGDAHCVPPNFRIDFVHPTEEEMGQHLYSNYNLGDANNGLRLESVDRTIANSKALHSFQKETLVSETRKVIEVPIKNTRLNLNQKICNLPRDSKGRFISSARMNGVKEGEILYSRWKQADSHKPIKRSTNSVKTSAIHNETNFVMNPALSNARSGKSTSIQTFIPACRDYHGGKKCISRDKSFPAFNGAVAGQAAFSSWDIEISPAGREVPLANIKLNHVEAPLSEKPMDLAKFFIQSRCSDYGYIGWPLDSQGELIKYIPNTTDGVNELYRIQNCTTAKEHLVAECPKRLPDFNFVESMDVSSNISEVGRLPKICSNSVLCNLNDPSQQNYSIPCKQADCCHQHSASKSNQLKPDKVGLAQSSAHDQIRMTGSSISKTDTSSTLTACMHSNIESRYNGEQKQKSPVSEKTCPEVESSRKEQPSTQPVMRLMGHNFIIGGEKEAGNTLKEYQQASDKKTSSASEAILDVSSSNKTNTAHTGYYTACKEGELSFLCPGINALCQHPIRKENLSECPQKICKPMESLETTSFACNTTEEPRRWNSSVPKLVEKRFPTSYVRCEQSLRGQFYSEPAWTSASPFCAIGNTLISPVSHLSSNTVVNQGDKLACKYSCNYTTSEFVQTEQSRSAGNLHGTYFQNTPEHIRDPARLHQNQVYSQNQSSSLVLHAFPKPMCSGFIHTSRTREAASNPGSFIIESNALQLLENQSKSKSNLPQWLLNAQEQKEAKEGTSYNKKQYSAPVLTSRKVESVTEQMPSVSSSSVSFSDPLHDYASALAHPTCYQTTFPSDCETLSPTDSATLKMNGINLLERENTEVPKNMNRNICAISHDKVTVPDTVNLVSPESKCRSDRRAGPRKASVRETKELHGKWLPQRNEGYAQGPSQKCDFILTGQMLHKRKTDIRHEINSSKYGKKKEISENDFVDGRAAEICVINDSSAEIAMGEDSHDGGNCSNKNRVNEIFSNASLHSGVSKKCRENEGAFRIPKSNLLESQIGICRIGLHSRSTESSLKLAEPVKLSGGAKHILKPPPPNGNVKQSLPIHYTLPFVETAAEERERNLHGTNRYSGEQQRPSPGSKLLRWASSNSNLSQRLSNGEGRLSH